MKTILTILLVLIGIKIDYANKYLIKPELVKEKIELSIEDSIRVVLSSLKLEKFTIELIVAQSKHESGNYKNNLTKEHNNIFARHYSKSDTFALGSGGQAEGHNRFARYKSIKNATLSQYYYFKRKEYSFNWQTTEDFAKELKQKRYYEDNVNNYTKSLAKLIK